MAAIKTMTPDEMASKVTPELLEESCQQYQQELIQMPIYTMQQSGTAKYITILPGIRNQITWGELDGDAELSPWSKTKKEEDDSKATGRTLAVYPGNCAKEFDPMPYFHTIYGESIRLGQALTANAVARKVATMFAAKIGEHIDMDAIFGGKRNVAGKKTKDLFDGFDTIIAAEETAGNLSAANGNFIDAGSYDKTNAVELAKSIYRAANYKLKDRDTFMLCPPSFYDAYVDDYQTRNGSLPYNNSFDKDAVEGSRGKCHLAPLQSMEGSEYIKITTRPNLILGTDINNQENKANIAKYSSWVLTFEYAGVYGAQIRSISKEALMVAKIKAATTTTSTGTGN